jgi:hypothetical protein
VAESERVPVIRINVDQQIPIESLHGHEFIEDTTVATEVISFNREDDSYILEGALIFSGFLRESHPIDDEIFGHLQGDVIISSQDEKKGNEQILPLYHRLPFQLHVPVTVQESKFLNVYARVGQWDLRIIRSGWAYVQAELIIYGLNGSEGYVFRCGDQQEDVPKQAQDLDQLLDQVNESFTEQAENQRDPYVSDDVDLIPSQTYPSNLYRQEAQSDEAVPYNENEWMMSSFEERSEEKEEVVFTPDPQLIAQTDPWAARAYNEEQEGDSKKRSEEPSVEWRDSFVEWDRFSPERENEGQTGEREEFSGVEINAEPVSQEEEQPIEVAEFEHVADDEIGSVLPHKHIPEMKVFFGNKKDFMESPISFSSLTKGQVKDSGISAPIDFGEAINDTQTDGRSVEEDPSVRNTEPISSKSFNQGIPQPLREEAIPKEKHARMEHAEMTPGSQEKEGKREEEKHREPVSSQAAQMEQEKHPNEEQRPPADVMEVKAGSEVSGVSSDPHSETDDMEEELLIEAEHDMNDENTIAVLDIAESSDMGQEDALVTEKSAAVSIAVHGNELWKGWNLKDDNKFTLKFRIVQETDHLDSLAERYSCSVTEIMRANGMSHEQLDSGQVLYIPTRRR